MSTIPIQPDDETRSGGEPTGNTRPLDLQEPAPEPASTSSPEPRPTPAPESAIEAPREHSTTWASTAPESPTATPVSRPLSTEPSAPPVQPAAPAVPAPPAQTWVEGPHWGVVIVGLLCMAVGGVALWQLASGQLVDWDRYGPIGLGVVGLLMLLAGTIGLIRRGRASHKASQGT